MECGKAVIRANMNYDAREGPAGQRHAHVRSWLKADLIEATGGESAFDPKQTSSIPERAILRDRHKAANTTEGVKCGFLCVAMRTYRWDARATPKPTSTGSDSPVRLALSLFWSCLTSSYG